MNGDSGFVPCRPVISDGRADELGVLMTAPQAAPRRVLEAVAG
jgi:hypothetical protein